jgi:hypothetical protein
LGDSEQLLVGRTLLRFGEDAEAHVRGRYPGGA